MNPGQNIMIYGNPVKCINPEGWATLIKKLEDHGELELWTVEFHDQREKYYNVLIKKT